MSDQAITDQAKPLNGTKVRADLLQIARFVPEKSRVLDIGCGDGSLLDHLSREKGVRGRGIELSQNGVNACVSQGLSVIQGDADRDLVDYPTDAFDVAILSQTLQATRDPRHVLEQLVRIGHRAIVSFPNFGHWRVRLALFTQGRMPVTEAIPEQWYETANIHLCTLKDFLTLCQDLGVTVDEAIALDDRGQRKANQSMARANWTAEHGLFVLCKPRT